MSELVIIGGLDVVRRSGAVGRIPKSATMLATPAASTAHIVAAQLPRLANIDPERVVVQLGQRDLLDGYDESYFHAQAVDLCDQLGQVTARAAVVLVAIPPFGVEDERLRGHLREQCNAAAANAADLRGYGWAWDLADAIQT